MATVRSLPTVALVLMAVSSCIPMVSAGSDCYAYHDHAAQYHLDHQAPKYPWDEVESMMKQNPSLSEVLAKGTKVPTSRPPGQHYYTAVSVVCPSDRFMLKAFTVDNKHCYVIKPQVQQLRYTRCSAQHNRDCQYCNYKKGGISKCEEDYEWQTVWAYCKSIPKPHPYPQLHPYPHPLPYPKPNLGHPVPEPKPYPPVAEPRPYPPVAEPKPYPAVAEPRPYPLVAEPKPYHPPKHTGYPVAEPPVAEPKPYPAVAEPKPYPAVAEPKPYLPKRKGYPEAEPGPYPAQVYYPAKLYAKHYYDPYAYKRWKRSVQHGASGKVEKLSLYLPYQCSCKSFKC